MLSFENDDTCNVTGWITGRILMPLANFLAYDTVTAYFMQFYKPQWVGLSTFARVNLVL